MQAPRTLGRLVASHIGRRNASYGHGHAQSTYNDMPIPQGSWKTQFDADQRKYNAHLVVGVGFLVGTILFGKVAGMWEFHNDIPKVAPPIDYKA